MKLEIVFKDGRKETFDSVKSFNVAEDPIVNEEWFRFNVSNIPKEGKLFKVDPLGINRSYFEEPMSDQNQERTRQIIQEAFAEVDKHPERYNASFYTLIPVINWDYDKSVKELKKYASDFGGLMADWVEQALEWAQRISNGESWESICNITDTANWYRMISWKGTSYRIVGGSHYLKGGEAVATVRKYDYNSMSKVYNTVPLVVIKKK